jgi:hypothetical protein
MTPIDRSKDSSQRSINWKTASQIIGGWTCSLALAVGNHFFFAYFNHRNTEDYSDTVVTAVKNTFAQVIQLLLGLVLTLVLVQGVRPYVAYKYSSPHHHHLGLVLYPSKTSQIGDFRFIILVAQHLLLSRTHIRIYGP